MKFYESGGAVTPATRVLSVSGIEFVRFDIEAMRGDTEYK